MASNSDSIAGSAAAAAGFPVVDLAAETVTPEIVNFMATHGRGLICAPLIEDRCEELGLELMVGKNTAAFETPFTVSVDLIGHGCSTGISAHDRFKTIRALVDPDISPANAGRARHVRGRQPGRRRVDVRRKRDRRRPPRFGETDVEMVDR